MDKTEDKCAECRETLSRRHKKIRCTNCNSAFHTAKIRRCVQLDGKEELNTWICKQCQLQQNPYYGILPGLSESLHEAISYENTEVVQDYKFDIPASWNKGIVVAHVNINSIRNKFEEVKCLLNCNKCSFISFTESKLDGDRDTDSQFMVNGYTMIRQDRKENQGGGIIAYINGNYKYEVIEINFNLPMNSEALIVKIWKEFVKPILIITIYKHPSYSLNEFMNSFYDISMKLTGFEFEKIMLGDFNINLVNTSTFDTNVYKYKKLYRDMGWFQVMKKPTRMGALLYHVYLNNTEKMNDCDCYVVMRKPKLKFAPNVIYRRSFKNVNWEAFDLNLAKLNETEHIESHNSWYSGANSHIQVFNENITSVLEKHAPLKKRIVKGKPSPWMDMTIVNTMK